MKIDAAYNILSWNKTEKLSTSANTTYLHNIVKFGICRRNFCAEMVTADTILENYGIFVQKNEFFIQNRLTNHIDRAILCIKFEYHKRMTVTRTVGSRILERPFTLTTGDSAKL